MSNKERSQRFHDQCVQYIERLEAKQSKKMRYTIPEQHQDFQVVSFLFINAK